MRAVVAWAQTTTRSHRLCKFAGLDIQSVSINGLIRVQHVAHQHNTMQKIRFMKARRLLIYSSGDKKVAVSSRKLYQLANDSTR